MKNLITAIIIIILQNNGYNQSVEMQVISGAANTNNGQLEFTLGEPVIAGSNTLTQGFHQGKLLITMEYDINKDIDILVFPNPAMEGINIQAKNLHNIKLKLFDISGKQLFKEQINSFPYYLELKKFKSGIFLLQLYDKNQILKTFKIEKI